MSTINGTRVPPLIHPFKFRDKAHSDYTMRAIYEAWQDEMYYDIYLEVDGVRYGAHKLILIAFSPYFKAMLTIDMRELRQDCIELKLPLGCDTNTFRLLLEYGYTGEVEITGDNVQELLISADFLQLTNVKSACIDFLKKNMDTINCLGILRFADNHYVPEVKEAAKTFCLQNFSVVSQEKEFLETTPIILNQLLKDESLRIEEDGIIPEPARQEAAVCEAVLRYIKHDVDGRRDLLGRFLEKVRLPLLAASVLDDLEKEARNMGAKNVCALIDKAREKRPSGTDKGTWDQPRQVAPLVIEEGMEFAFGRGEEEIDHFDDVFQEKGVYVKGMKLWIRPWLHSHVLCGMEVHYSNGVKRLHGCDDFDDEFEFTLEDNERIIKVEPQAGWMVDSLTFYSNKGTEYGPYGGHGGDLGPEDGPPEGANGYLAGVAGTKVYSYGAPAIRRLRFKWAYYKLPK